MWFGTIEWTMVFTNSHSIFIGSQVSDLRQFDEDVLLGALFSTRWWMAC